MSKLGAISKGMGRGTAQAGVVSGPTRPPVVKNQMSAYKGITKKDDYRTKSYAKATNYKGGGQEDAGGGGRKPPASTLERSNVYAIRRDPSSGGRGGDGGDGSAYYEGADASEQRETRTPYKTVSGKGKKKKKKKK